MKNNDLKDKLSDKGIADLKNFYQELEPEKQVKFLKTLDALVDEARNNIDIDLALLFEDEFEYDDLENYLEDEKDISEYDLTEEKAKSFIVDVLLELHNSDEGLQKHYKINDENTLKFFKEHQAWDVEHTKECEFLINALSDKQQEQVQKGAVSGAKLLWNFLDSMQEIHCYKN